MIEKLLKSPVGRLRAVGFLEGVSFLMLLGIAMPLKYMAGLPLAVRIVGSLHGFLFILFMIALAHVKFRMNWSLSRVAEAFFAALLPFGTFYLDRKLRKDENLNLQDKAANQKVVNSQI